MRYTSFWPKRFLDDGAGFSALDRRNGCSCFCIRATGLCIELRFQFARNRFWVLNVVFGYKVQNSSTEELQKKKSVPLPWHTISKYICPRTVGAVGIFA